MDEQINRYAEIGVDRSTDGRTNESGVDAAIDLEGCVCVYVCVRSTAGWHAWMGTTPTK